MIPKQRTDYQNVEGAGRPFEVNERSSKKYVECKNDAERNVPVIIHLGDLNGQTYDKGMPKNFNRKAGRTLQTFTSYWSPDETAEKEFDIE